MSHSSSSSSPSTSPLTTRIRKSPTSSSSSSSSLSSSSSNSNSTSSSSSPSPSSSSSSLPSSSSLRYNNNRLASPAQQSQSHPHRHKRPIKPALKNSNAYNYNNHNYSNSNNNNNNSPSLSPAQKRSCTFGTPSSSLTPSSSSSSSSPLTCSSSFNRRRSLRSTSRQGGNSKSISDNSANNKDDDDDDYDETWRKDGKEYRSKLLKDDDETGGNEFVINRQCKLKNYCAIADRVQDQFQTTYEAGDKLEESYVMGNRLIKFLSEVLPTHHHYYSKHPEFTKLRIKTQNDLLKVRNQMEDIAYAFDREVYKSVMEMQGLEYDLSPGRSYSGKVRRPRRKKKVTFALEVKVDESENAYDHDHGHVNERVEEHANAGTGASSSDNYRNRKSFSEKQVVVPKLKGPTYKYVAPKTPSKRRGAQSMSTSMSMSQNHNPQRLDLDFDFDPSSSSTNTTTDTSPNTSTTSTISTATPSPVESLASAFDLSLWENRDPDMDIVDMSFSDHSIDQCIDPDHDNDIGNHDHYDENDNDNDQDLSSSFDVSSSSLEAITPSSFQDQIDDQKKKEEGNNSISNKNNNDNSSNDFQGDVDVFNSISNRDGFADGERDEDGWESFQGSSSSDFTWPEMYSFQSSGATEKEGSTSIQNAVHPSMNKQDNSLDNHDDNNDDDESERSSDFESISDDLLLDLDGDLDMSMELPFVEKIARENIYRGINALGEEEDDSDAADSWEQDDDVDQNEDEGDNFQTADLSLGSAISMEGSITAMDVQFGGGRGEEEEEEEEEEDEQEEEQHNISNTDEHLRALHEEFLSSYEYNEDDSHSENSEDGEHNKFVREMTKSEFQDETDFPDEISPCDSSGADKTVYTIATAETEAMTADDDSEGSKSDENEDEEAIIGISRRDSYYPSFDSPQRNDISTTSHDKTVLPIKLDYLEYKVKDLQVKQENSRVKTTTVGAPSASVEHYEISTNSSASSLDLKPRRSMKAPYPVQMARVEKKEVTSTAFSTGEELQKTLRPQPQSKPVKTKKSEERGFSNESSRPHPTAARIKNLKKTAAWKRRFGRQ